MTLTDRLRVLNVTLGFDRRSVCVSVNLYMSVSLWVSTIVFFCLSCMCLCVNVCVYMWMRVFVHVYTCVFNNHYDKCGK